MSRGPCNDAATSSFGYHPSAFPVLHLQRFRLICRSVLVDRLSSDQHRVSYLYVRGFDIPLVVCITFHLHLLLKISLVQLFKVMCTGSNSNGKPGTELAARIHQVCWSDLGGAMRRCPIGAEESVDFLLEIWSHQLANLIKLLQYPDDCLASALACGFRGVFRLWRKPKYLLQSLKSFPLNGGPFSLGITALALDCLQTVTSRYSPVCIGPQKSIATSFHGSLSRGVMRSGPRSCDIVTT